MNPQSTKTLIWGRPEPWGVEHTTLALSTGSRRPASRRPDQLIGRVLDGKYEIVRHLGSGGFGDVYLAHARAWHSDVAVKVLNHISAESGGAVRRFLREAKILQDFVYESVLAPADFGADRTFEPAVLYLVMKLLYGKTVQDLLSWPKGKPLRFGFAMWIARKMLRRSGHFIAQNLQILPLSTGTSNPVTSSLRKTWRIHLPLRKFAGGSPCGLWTSVLLVNRASIQLFAGGPLLGPRIS